MSHRGLLSPVEYKFQSSPKSDKKLTGCPSACYQGWHGEAIPGRMRGKRKRIVK